MRIVHTSDWHAGRVWKGRSRNDELEAVLDHLAQFIERERIDVVLVTGDVFDHGAPSPESERTVFGFLKRVGVSGAQTVVIAGNHDHRDRMAAWGTLAELVGVRTVVRPSAGPDGVVELATRSGERAIVAALPFATVGDLLSAATVAGEETLARQRYADLLRDAISKLASRFRADAVNLFMAHTHLEGAVLAHSERRVHCSEQWAALAQAFPPDAHYVALGHIHKPQLVVAPSPARYAGSPLQLDFGEVGDAKSFVVVDAIPRMPARIETVAYEGAKPLRDVTLPLDEIPLVAASLESAWVRITVPLDAPDPDVAAKVRRLVPSVVDVRVLLPPSDATPSVFAPRLTTAREEYAAYYVAKKHREASEDVLAMFDKLHAECAGG